jgi:hypothetical protein
MGFQVVVWIIYPPDIFESVHLCFLAWTCEHVLTCCGVIEVHERVQRPILLSNRLALLETMVQHVDMERVLLGLRPSDFER